MAEYHGQDVALRVLTETSPDWRLRAELAEARLFDLVSGLCAGPNDWMPLAEHCQLLEPKAREIAAAVLSEANIERIAKAALR